MNILNAILGAGDGQAVGALAQQFGLSNDQASSAVGALLPALAGGLQRNVTQQGKSEALVGALTSGQHGRYLDDPGSSGRPTRSAMATRFSATFSAPRTSAAPSPATRRRPPASARTC